MVYSRGSLPLTVARCVGPPVLYSISAAIVPTLRLSNIGYIHAQDERKIRNRAASTEPGNAAGKPLEDDLTGGDTRLTAFQQTVIRLSDGLPGPYHLEVAGRSCR
jgi:hypothetical protein